MRRVFAVVTIAVGVLFAAPQVRAQSPQPETSEDADSKPWGRLFVFVPVSIALGAGAVYGRRWARDRGWSSS